MVAVCPAGQYNANPGGAADCQTCPANSYCPGNDQQVACDANFVSPAGSIASANCTCSTGGFYLNGGACDSCVGGNWCAGGVSTACAAGTDSPAGSDAATDCTCYMANTFGPPGGPCDLCTVCQAEEYESSVCTAHTDRVCKQCGYTAGAEPPFVWCNESNAPQTCTFTCPTGSGISMMCNASHDTVCSQCSPGWYTKQTIDCEVGWSRFGSYCYKLVDTSPITWGQNFAQARALCSTYDARLPEQIDNAAASFIRTNSGISVGFMAWLGMISEGGVMVWENTRDIVPLWGDGGCAVYSSNVANRNALGVNACPWISYVDTTTDRSTYCQRFAFDEREDCTQCEANFHCAAGVKTACPASSLSPAGSDGPEDCYCPSGFWDANSDPSVADCQACPVGYTCNGGVKTICPANSWCGADNVVRACFDTFFSPQGSHLMSNCSCAAGYEANYTNCPAGYVQYPYSSFKCYSVLSTAYTNLVNQASACQGLGAGLPTEITTNHELHWLSDLNTGSPNFYVAASRDANGKPWFWFDTLDIGGTNLPVNNLSWVSFSAMETTLINSVGWHQIYYDKASETMVSSNTLNSKPRCYLPKAPDSCALLPSPCAPGTYGSILTGCKTCEMGYYCPGGSDRVQCPGGALTDPIYGATSVDNCMAPTCGNFHLEAGEQCDNGPSPGDGCSASCTFEDSSGTGAGPEWVCTTSAPLATTSCCPSLQNPVSHEYVCSCAGYTSPKPGVTVKSDCTIEDVDECRTDNGGCADNAVCVNHVSTLTTNSTHECICPPGMVGDGVARCDIYVYQVTFTMAVQGITVFDVNEAVIIQSFLTNGVFPQGTTVDDVTLHVTEYSGSFGGVRRLLATGVEIQTTLETNSSLDMQNAVNNIDTDAAASSIQGVFGNDTVVEMTQPPTQQVVTVDQAFGTVSTVLTGFQVDSVVYDNVKWEWIIRARYVDGAPNVITSMFMSKTGAPPYDQDTINSYFISQQPCMRSSSVCCMTDYRDTYTIGAFATNITNELGTCVGEPIASENTVGLFDSSDAKNAYLIDNMLSEYPNSYVVRINPTTVDVHIYRFDLRDSIAMTSDIVGGYSMDFLLGMAYYTLLPAPAVSTVISQTRIHATYTDTVAFSTTSQQDYTFLQYITVAVFDTKVIMNIIDEKHPQAVRVGFVIPADMEQNMRTGLVPLTSVRYHIGTSLPSPDSPTAWTNPCHSSSGSGLWDTTYQGAANPLYDMYDSAASQTCALQPDICTNPLQAQIKDRLVEFWFPIGDGTISSLPSTQSRSIYIYFDVSLIDDKGRYVQAKMFAQAPLTDTSMTMMCQTLTAASEVADIADVSLAVGIVGADSEWDMTMSTFDNIISAGENLVDLTINTTSPSIQNGLITVVVHGQDAPFTGSLATNYELAIDFMISIHFLDDTIYNTVSALFKSGNAWTLQNDGSSGFLKLVLSDAVQSACLSSQLPGDVSCAIRTDIAAREVPQAYAAHPLATGMNTHDLNVDSAWLQTHLLGYSEYSDGLARNFTNIIRTRYAINDRYRKGWYVNPGYPWSARAGSAAQSILSLSDRTIIAAVVALDDGSGNVRRRMLLQIDSAAGPSGRRILSHTIDDITQSPINRVMPTIENLAVNPLQQVANAFGVYSNYGFASARIRASSLTGSTYEDVRDELQRRVRARLAAIAPTASNAWIAQYKPVIAAGGARRLLAESDDVYVELLLLLQLTNQTNVIYNMTLAEALQDASVNNTVVWNVLVSDFSLTSDKFTNFTALAEQYQAAIVHEAALAATTPPPLVDLFGKENGAGATRVSLISALCLVVVSLAASLW